MDRPSQPAKLKMINLTVKLTLLPNIFFFFRTVETENFIDVIAQPGSGLLSSFRAPSFDRPRDHPMDLSSSLTIFRSSIVVVVVIVVVLIWMFVRMQDGDTKARNAAELLVEKGTGTTVPDVLQTTIYPLSI